MTIERRWNEMSHYLNYGTPQDHLADKSSAQDDLSKAPLTRGGDDVSSMRNSSPCLSSGSNAHTLF